MKRRYIKRLRRQLWAFALTDPDSPSQADTDEIVKGSNFCDAARCYASAARPQIFEI